MANKANLNILLITAGLLLGILSVPAPAGIIYVDSSASGVNDGSSWPDAFNFLQDGLSVAEYGDEIRVAQGTYTPDKDLLHPLGTDDRAATFQLINGAALYGGFPVGGGTQRDSALYETILSGDIAGDDIIDPNKTENSYHVVTASGIDPNTILDGFTITAGNADEPYPSPHRAGGGMNNLESSPTVTNCIFSGNLAYQSGGGMCNGYSSPTVTGCTFAGNSADNGGGMSNGGFCNPAVTNCIFTGNSADEGGGMSNAYNIPTITGCIFISNSASVDGGGMHNAGNVSAIVTDCFFIDNSAGHYGSGGGMYNWDSNPTATNCTFMGNSADMGGGMSNHGNNQTVINCTFSGNSAGWGGGMLNWQNDLTVANCIFAGNRADFGGGMFNWDSSSPTVTGCTFTGNLASNGNAIECDSNMESDPSNVHISNSILWDGGDEIFNNDGSTITITYSDIQGGWTGEGNIDADPCFVSPGWWDPNGTPDITSDDFWVEGDYHLKWLSPCFNAGDPNDDDYFGQTDMDGRARVRYGRVDMGAHEIFPLGCDFEPDEDVDLADFTSFRAAWTAGDCNEPADFNGDCLVDISDLVIFFEYWLAGAGETVSMLDNLWMYQNAVYITNSTLTASAWVIDDPLANSSYTYDWEMVLPDDVTMAPVTITGGGPGDISCTFGAPQCFEPNGISDSGQPFTVKVTITGNDYGNIIMAEAQFGIALLGDVNNDGVVNIADRSIINAFWRTGSAGSFTLRDCDINSDGVVNIADRSIVNAVWRGAFGQNSVTTPCPFR